jgi:hypothetical protein
MLEQRQKTRFGLHLPYEIHPMGARNRITGLTKNVSAEGVLFNTSPLVEIGEQIRYQLTLPAGSRGMARVQVHCTGRVIRVDPGECAASIDSYEFVREMAASAAA